MRDLTHPGGGFYSAEDADSFPMGSESGHKVEGAFYVWGKQEIISLLGPEAGNIFCLRYGVEENGNAESDPMMEFKNKNILYCARTVGEAAGNSRKARKRFRRCCRRERTSCLRPGKRPRPHLDDKVLASWNGLMLSALAGGYCVLGEAKYLKAAVKAAEFLQKNSMIAKPAVFTGAGGTRKRKSRL